MRTAAVAFLASTLIAAVLTPAVRNLAHRLGWLDHALTSRKIHGKPIPRLGGIAIVAAFYAPLVALLFVNSDVGSRFYAEPRAVFGLFAGGLAIAALGLYDDLKGCGARMKFAVQFSIAAGLYALGFRIDTIANPFGAPFHLGVLAVPFTLLWIAGVINAMNLLDGLDGLAGGVALAAVTTTFAIAALRTQPLMILFTAALGGAIVGFLFYNFNPASIFMGDSGSMFLGFVLAATSIQTSQKSPTMVAMIVPIVALGVPIADTLLAMARRAARGAPLFSADRGHIHHRLLDLGLTHRQTVLVLYGASCILGVAALVLTTANSHQAALLLVAVSGVAFVALRRLGFMRLSMTEAAAALGQRRRNLKTRAAIRRVGEALRRCDRLDDLWDAVRGFGPLLGATGVDFHVGRAGVSWSSDPGSGPAAFRARYGLLAERPGDDHLEFAWTDGRTGVDRDTEIAIELLCDQVSAVLDRIEEQAATARRVANLRR
ncbi:MAG TPA: MraY family glycosyltransferase [Anaeromyxobacteraceae bacterium]|nr:MraY family glycosyltransferase [Anaeromyxobacteraceae bacterium]